MVKIPPIDLDASEAVSLAPSDPDEAAKALLMAEQYIREGKPLPDPLDRYVADAIKHSMKKSGKHRNTAFLRELYLEAENRRPVKARWVQVGTDVGELIEFSGYSQNKAVETVREKYDIGRSATVRLYKVWKEAQKENDRILREIWESETQE